MQSRIEDILQAIINGTPASELPPPQSRNEALLLQILEQGAGGGGAIPMHICGSSEYDSDTGIPTVSNPEQNMFYLVPSGLGSPDMFEEWIYINDGWEHFGAGGHVVIPQSDWNQTDASMPDYIKNKPGNASGVSF